MPDNESTMKWKVDISQLKAGMQDAKRSISLANAEFKAATAGLDNWSKSATGLEAKIAQLNKTLPQQKTILSQLEKQYEITAKALGESSSEATKLKIQIENQKGAIAKTEAQISKYNAELTSIIASEESLTKKIADQEVELKDLKKTYADIAAQYGKDSKEAQDLAKQIEKLSSDLVANKAKMADATAAADKLDKSLVETGKGAEKAGDGFTVLKGMAANLAAQGLTALYNGVKKVGKELIKTFNEVTESADEIDKGAQKLSLTAESYQKLSYAMELSGGSINDVSKGIKNITTALADTQKGVAGASSKFDALGISLKNADGSMKTTEEVLLEVIGTLAEMDDEVTRNAAANDIFGKSYQDLAPLLNEGKDGINALMQEAVDYNMVISNDSVKAAAAYRDSIDRLNGTFNGLKTRVVQQFLPALTTIIDGFTELASGTDTSGAKIKKGINNLFKDIKKAIKQGMPELYDNVVKPVEKATKVLKNFVTFIVKNFKTIAPVVTSAVAAFAAFNAVMAVSKTVSSVNAAIGALSAGVSLATKVQIGYNAALASNPIGAVLTAIVALIAAVALLAKTESEAEKAHRMEMEALQEQSDALDDAAAAWADLEKAQREQYSAGMNEIAYYQNLANELRSITDENGKVKKGYEDRADFIRTELSNALDIEITKTGDVIDNYTGIMNAIDLLIEKKRAQIILDSQEALYKEAIEHQAEAYRELYDIQTKVTEKENELNDLKERQKKLDEEISKMDYMSPEFQQAQKNSVEMTKAIEELSNELDGLYANEKKADEQMKRYAFNIGQYEQNMTYMHEGNYAKMTQVNSDYYMEYQNHEEATKDMLEDSIKYETEHLQYLKDLKEKEGTDIYDQQIKNSEQLLRQYQEDLTHYQLITKNGLEDNYIVWNDSLDDQLSAITGHDVDFLDAGDGLVQMYVDGLAVGEPVAKQEMADIATATIAEISKKETDSKAAGEQLIDGINQGIGNLKKQQSAFATISNFGDLLLSSLKTSLKEHSPSKASEEDAVNLLAGIEVGVEKRTPKTLKTVANFGKRVIDTLKEEMGEEVSLTGVKSSMKGELDALKNSVAAHSNSVANGGNFGVIGSGDNNTTTQTQNVTFNQTINSPKAVDGMTLYRETNNLLFSAKVRMQNV